MNTENLIECTHYEGDEPELNIIVYKSPDNERFIKKCVYKSQTIYLKVGETRDDVLVNAYPYFPWVYFDVKEAKKYGLKNSCAGIYKFSNQFKNLTCDPDLMENYDEQMLEQTDDSHRKIYKAKCPNCGTIWQVTEVFQDRYFMYYDKIID